MTDKEPYPPLAAGKLSEPYSGVIGAPTVAVALLLDPPLQQFGH